MKIRNGVKSLSIASLMLCGGFLFLEARTIVVNNQAANASDGNAGTEALPMKTIQAAADLAQGGDTVFVRAGIYREWVKPPRGGSSEDKRIVYRAAPGETVSIRGSEQIKTWVDQGNNVWLATLDNTFFGSFNPYKRKIYEGSEQQGGWLNYGKESHRGEVFLNLDALYEKTTLAAVQSTAKTWFTDSVSGKTRVYANFGGINPNTAVTEINVRESGIFPAIEKLGYITIEGFDVRQTATFWCYHGSREIGAIGPNFGLRWIIQNCTISDSKCVGIALGSASLGPTWPIFVADVGLNFPSGTTFGHHIIRNNHITRSGSTGIFGQLGGFAGIIEGNFIEKTGYKKEFGGWEKAGIKMHYSMDCIIRNNRISIIHPGVTRDDCPAIFLDWGAQNVRITGNVMYAESAGSTSGLKIEVSHGPVMVDNNVFVNLDHNQWSSAGIFVHNLFCESLLYYTDGLTQGRRSSNIFLPHSTADALPRKVAGLRDDRILNNIFIKTGPRDFPTAVNYRVDNNLYLDGAVKKSGYDSASVTDNTATTWLLVKTPSEVNLTINFSATSVGMNCPQITSASLGKFVIPNMFMENQDGTPITIDSDYFNKSFNPALRRPGPIQTIAQGSNTLKLWPKSANTTVVTPRVKRATVNSAPSQTEGALYDIRGRLVARSSGNSAVINAKRSAGVYIVKTGNGKQCVAHRVLLQK